MSRGWQRDVQYVGSFQHGQLIRTSNPLDTVWREVERVGTVESVARIASARSQPATVYRPAVLKIRQAVELRRATKEASILTKPLLQYYSMLNLVRGVMLAIMGDFGSPLHGLKYEGGSSLLECSATVTRNGTFRTFVETIGVDPALLNGKACSLRNLFAVIPECKRDFYLLRAGESSVVTVTVTAYIGGATYLDFSIPDIDAAQFAASWAQLFPWMADVTEHEGPLRLRTKVQLPSEACISAFCAKYLIQDLRRRESAVWFDHRVGGSVTLMPRLPAYMAAMFVLSNVARYEPEYLDDSAVSGTDLGYFLAEFLSNAERFFPQLVLELMNRKPIFFE